MAPKYKLTYFNLMGLGEPIRYLLSYMEVNFEDVRVEMEEWPNKKSATPFGKLPILEVDGKALTQSLAIARYLGKKAGIAGKDDWENAQIDIIADTITDLRMPIRTFFREPDEDKKKSMRDTFVKETLAFYMEKLEAIAKENGGYLANKKLSWVDFVFVALTEFLNYACDSSDITANYPNLHALCMKIMSLPQIKKWIEKRPKTNY